MRSNTIGGSIAAFSIEPLEGRQLFAATVTPLAAEPAAPFIAKINFQPAGAAIPGGYLADTGSSYASRGNGFTYGWSSTNNQAVDRNSSRSPDQRYDTFNRISSTTWSLAVPNGRYVVKLVCGDAYNSNATYRVMAEGEMVVDGKATNTNRWVNGSAVIDVTDGKLTVHNAPGETRNQVNFIEVYQTDLPTTVTIGPENSGGFTRSGPADFLLRPSGSTTNVAKVEFFAGTMKLGEDTAAPFGLYYKNVDPGKVLVTTRITNKTGGVTTSAAVPLRIKDSVVSWMTIGGSTTVAADRGVGWNIKTEGWQGFVDKVIKPQLAWGAKRIALHNPFGTLANEPMQMDQYLHARDAKLNWLTQGFVEAWKPVTASGVEVIAYLGMMNGDADFAGTGWKQRFLDSVRPALDAGMSIALDSAAVTTAGSITHQAAQLLRQMGVEVYIEARPAAGYSHWFDYNVISIDSFWDRSDPDRFADAVIWAPNSVLKREVMRIIFSSPTGQNWSQSGWVGAYSNDVIRSGHAVAAPVWRLMSEGVSLEDVI